MLDMGPKCDRIFIGLTVAFSLTTFAALGVLIWREYFVDRQTIIYLNATDSNNNIISKENILRLFPINFKVVIDNQIQFENAVIEGTNRLTPVNQTFDDGKLCDFTCYNQTLLGRRKRATSNDVFHACCVSNIYFISPARMHNIYTVERELFHLNPLRQIFKSDNCSQAIGCTGCTCMHQMDLVAGVVYKPGYTQINAFSLDHLEIDLFYLPGCCKCVNT